MSVSLSPPRKKPDSQTEALAIQRQIHDLVERHFALKHGSKPFSPGETPVPVSGRCFDASDVKALVDSALDFWLTAGPYNEQFQTNLAKRIGVRYALTVNSGSSANLVAFSALTSPLLRERQVPAGSEVITAAAGFPTTVNPAMMCGMTPVFVDVDIPTYNIIPDLVEEAVTPKTRAIMVAHTLGNPFDAVRLADIAKRHKLFLIEDCCDALWKRFATGAVTVTATPARTTPAIDGLDGSSATCPMATTTNTSTAIWATI